MKKKKLVYRMPNVLEAFDILKVVRVREGEKLDEMDIKKNLVSVCLDLVSLDAMGYQDKEALINDPDMFSPLAKMADDIYSKVVSAFVKKD